MTSKTVKEEVKKIREKIKNNIDELSDSKIDELNEYINNLLKNDKLPVLKKRRLFLRF